MVLHALIPARFLGLTAHFVLNVTLYWSRDSNVLASLPITSSKHSAEYNAKDAQFLVALSLTLIFTMVELVGFFSGLSLFTSLPSLFSTAAHVGATILSTLFTVNDWSCDFYWLIFGLCSLPALLIEVIVLATFLFKVTR